MTRTTTWLSLYERQKRRSAGHRSNNDDLLQNISAFNAFSYHANQGYEFLLCWRFPNTYSAYNSTLGVTNRYNFQYVHFIVTFTLYLEEFFWVSELTKQKNLC